ncbi:MAG: MoaD/ThiS family protein [Proteobacteria bacterium]|jgi:molybdopterin converting factor small subunit|nr:MoaD/ThiS family protein [Pseudomonadota bacterium]NQY91837.1 MoaD/ThiS family protein [Deltaproteobacteria bacterium]
MKVRFFIRGYMLDTFVSFDRKLRLPDGCSMADAFVRVEKKAGVKLSRCLAESEVVAESILLNGERVPLPRLSETTLSDGDEVSVLSPLAGG